MNRELNRDEAKSYIENLISAFKHDPPFGADYSQIIKALQFLLTENEELRKEVLRHDKIWQEECKQLETRLKKENEKLKEYYEGDGLCEKCGIPLMPPSCANCDFKDSEELAPKERKKP
jgi:hypothetical protein